MLSQALAYFQKQKKNFVQAFLCHKDTTPLMMTFVLYVKLAGCKQTGKQQKVLSRLHHLNSWFKTKITL